MASSLFQAAFVLNFATVLFLVRVCSSQSEFDLLSLAESQLGKAIKCYRPDGSAQRCRPAFDNIAFGKSVVSNNTCGSPPREYCVQTGTSGAKKICDICDANKPGYSHPPYLINDEVVEGSPTWWQSQTLLESKYPVQLIMDLKKTYDVSFIRITFHTSRPHSMAIYKKSTYNEREAWKPFQFYSRTCDRTYNIPSNRILSLSNQNTALCAEDFSEISPLSGGNVAFLTLDHRPGKTQIDDYPELQEFITVSALRFDLDRLNTFGDEVFGDPKVLKSYYFAISNVAVGGYCKCNGHASFCDLSEGILACKCEHNTAGIDCERCMPLFNDRPWRPGSGKSANPCTQCNCNGLADACEFNEQLWIDSNEQSGGRCLNCKNNTAGDNCERCKEFHHRLNPLEACKPCNCNPIGSRSQRCNDQGQCACKPGVSGEKCDQCFPGYYGFSAIGCRACKCNVDGSRSQNCDATGQCQCKENTIGKQCDQCAANHFDLDASNPKGCKPCFCYGHGISCSAQEGIGRKEITSDFQVDLDGWRLEDEYGNDRSSLVDFDQRGPSVYIRPVGKQKLYLVAPQRYLGNRLSSYSKVLSFRYGVFRQPSDPDVEADQDIIFVGAGKQVSYAVNSQGNPLPRDRFVVYRYQMVEPEGVSAFEFQQVLSDLKALKIRVSYVPNRRGAIDKISMESTQFVSVNSPEQVTWQEQCQCEKGYAGVQCERCSEGFTRAVNGSGPYGKCVLCACNNHSSRCDPDTGVCECKDNTAGRNCEFCKPGFYGNPTRGNADDCKPCPCVFGRECVLLGTRVKCTDCPEGHIGDYCDVCEDGYFGDPLAKLGAKTSCRKCDCSGNVDPNAYGNCDSLTGACLKCINNTKNGPLSKCEECADGFYGNAHKFPKGDCKACNCYENGTILPANHKPGQPLACTIDGKCQCRDNVIGDRCDQCPPGFWNVASGAGCARCDCNPIGSLGTGCNVITGQCECKVGVAGRRCEGCAPGFFSFSAKGCTSCDCHPDGSVHQNCTDSGVCVCRPNVLGIKCDKCPENKFNHSAGCLACPPCFDLIQVAVNNLRTMLINLNYTVGNLNDSSIVIRDSAFESVVKGLQEQISELQKKVDGLLSGDKELYAFFQTLVDAFSKLTKRFDELKEMVTKIASSASLGEAEVGRAEETIKLIRELLFEADKLLNEKGTIIKERSASNAGDITEAAKRMRELAEEARQLADDHEKQAADIEMQANMALNQSKEAYNTAKNARAVEENTNKQLKGMGNDAEEASRRAKDADRLIQETSGKSKAVKNDADVLSIEAGKPVPDFGAQEMRQKAEQAAYRGGEVLRNASTLIYNNRDTIKEMLSDDRAARVLIGEGRKLINQSDELWKLALNASKQSKDAQTVGLTTLEDAKGMLETLKTFDERIKASEVNATKAMELIPIIRELIKTANLSAVNGSRQVMEALEQAMVSLTAAELASNISDMASKEINSLKAEVLGLLNSSTVFATDEVNPTIGDVVAADGQLDEYRKRAEADAIVLQVALNKSKAADVVAIGAQNELQKSLDEVEKIMEDLNKLEEIDLKTLRNAETRFARAKNTIELQIDREIKRLESLYNQQIVAIQQFEDDLSPLRKSIEHANALYNAIPKNCFKKIPGVEPDANPKLKKA